MSICCKEEHKKNNGYNWDEILGIVCLFLGKKLSW